MNCPVRTVVIDNLKDKEIIGDLRVILNSKLFDSENIRLTEKARANYGVKAEGNLLNKTSNTTNLMRGGTYRRDNLSTTERFEFNDIFIDELESIIKADKNEAGPIEENSSITELQIENINKLLDLVELPTITSTQYGRMTKEDQDKIKKCYG